MISENSPLKRYWQPVLILIAIILALWITWISLAVLIPFLIGILLAYLLFPLVKWLEKTLLPKVKAQKAKRAISIIVVFIVFATLLILFTIYIGAALVGASSMLVNKAPEFFSKGVNQLGDWIKIYRGSLPQVITVQIDSVLVNMGPAAGKFLQDFVVGSMAVIPASMPTIIGFITLPFFLFFVLNDYESFQKYFYNLLSPNAAKHTANILSIVGNVMGRYIRSTLILGLIVGFMVFIGLLILNVEYAPALGAVTAMTQFIPIVGPVISGFIIVVITLALQPDKVLWALLVVIVAQVLLNSIFLNWIQGKYMQLHPAVVMVLLVVGGYVAGFWGMILALPVAATIWEIIKYFRNERQTEKLQT